MAEDSVVFTLDDRVGRIRLNKPEKNNAMGFAMVEAFQKALEELEGVGDLAGLVVTGTGDKAFCGGVDASVLREQGQEAFGVLVERFWEMCWHLAHLPVPVIAAINGRCFAGGVMLALSCDLRVAVDSTNFAIPGSQYGASVSTYQLPFLTTDCWAKEIILLARPLGAAALYDAGLLNRVVTPPRLESTVEDWVARCRELSPTAVRNNKELLNEAYARGPRAAYEAELTVNLRQATGPEFRQRVALDEARKAAKAKPPS